LDDPDQLPAARLIARHRDPANRVLAAEDIADSRLGAEPARLRLEARDALAAAAASLLLGDPDRGVAAPTIGLPAIELESIHPTSR
jgi:hypothetical protein